MTKEKYIFAGFKNGEYMITHNKSDGLFIQSSRKFLRNYSTNNEKCVPIIKKILLLTSCSFSMKSLFHKYELYKQAFIVNVLVYEVEEKTVIINPLLFVSSDKFKLNKDVLSIIFDYLLIDEKNLKDKLEDIYFQHNKQKQNSDLSTSKYLPFQFKNKKRFNDLCLRTVISNNSINNVMNTITLPPQQFSHLI